MSTNPTIYYFPDASGTMETLDLGESLSTIEEYPGAERVDAQGGDGQLFPQYQRSFFSVRLTLERFGSAGTNTIERQLQTWWNHMLRGNPCGFSRDGTKPWCAYVNGAERGFSYVATSGNAFDSWSPGAALASGDEVVIEEREPGGRRDILPVSSVTASTQINVSETVNYSSTGLGRIVRWRDFYPILYAPAEAAADVPIKTDSRRNWTLDVRLSWCPEDVIALLARFRSSETLSEFGAGYRKGATYYGLGTDKVNAGVFTLNKGTDSDILRKANAFPSDMRRSKI